MVFALSHRLYVEMAEVLDIKCIEHAPMLGGMLQLCYIMLFQHSRIEHGYHTYPACS
jgi:hypothetical protein